MTISTTTNKVTVSGNGSTTVFNYSFEIPTGSGYELIYTDASGNQSVISTANYSVSGVGQTTGGTFTYSPAIASGTTLTFLRQVPEVQNTNFGNQDGYYPAVVEAALDWLTMTVQDLQEQVARCIKCPAPDTAAINTLPVAALRASKTLTFDSSGQPRVT